MLTDNFVDKQCAVQKTFCDLETDEQEVNHLLCKVHFLCTIQKALTNEVNSKAQEHLLAALYNQKTSIRCEKSINAAIDAALKKQKAYIKKE